MERYIYNINIALQAVFTNKFRAGLTALGIIFGVSAVIAMLAIGNGAKHEILEQIKLIGVNNIIVIPKVEQNKSAENKDLNKTNKKYSPGLTIKDAKSFQDYIPSINKISSVVSFESYIINDGIRKTATITGVDASYFSIFDLQIEEGQFFTESQIEQGLPVCIIGKNIKSKFFSKINPVNAQLKCGNIWFKVIGVIKDKGTTSASTTNLGISDYNNDIYIPIHTLLLRYKDRSLITASKIKSKDFTASSNNTDNLSNFNQLDRIVIQVDRTEDVKETTEIIKRMLIRRHADNEDFEIKIPELLLKQEQRTKDIFNIVLGAIASISLLIGGIGIMNIMLANVMERTKEIGVRLAVGATKKDVVFQFLTEATLISLTGGIIGIILGIVFSFAITKITGILTIISAISVFISFVVSASVGIIFGYMPAKKAAKADPVTSLRYE